MGTCELSEHRESSEEAKSVTCINETRMCTDRKRGNPLVV